MSKQEKLPERIKYRVLGKTLTAVLGVKTLTFTGEKEAKDKLKEMIENYNKKANKEKLAKILSRFNEKAEKKAVAVKAEKKKIKKAVKVLKKSKSIKKKEEVINKQIAETIATTEVATPVPAPVPEVKTAEVAVARKRTGEH